VMSLLIPYQCSSENEIALIFKKLFLYKEM
jgi:hypothetical protein